MSVFVPVFVSLYVSLICPCLCLLLMIVSVSCIFVSVSSLCLSLCKMYVTVPGQLPKRTIPHRTGFGPDEWFYSVVVVLVGS